MYKRILAILVIIALCITALGCGGGGEEEANLETPEQKIEQSVLVRPNTNEDFRYNVYTYYVEISECLSTKSNIVIPDTIQDLPVYKICDSAFEDQTTFSSLVMTNNIIEIGAYAFSGCTNLTSVTLSNNLTTLGEGVFSYCENLKEIEIPGSLSEIPGGAFSNCARLLSVKIEKSKDFDTSSDTPSEPFRLLSGAFSDCPELRVAWIPEDISEIADGEFAGSMDNLVICGAEESAAAQFAATNLIDFKTEAEFKDLSSSALSTQKKGIDEAIMSNSWKMTLANVYSFGSDFKYQITKRDVKSENQDAKVTEQKTEIVNNNENLIFIAMTINNLSGSAQQVNMLDFEVTVDGYERRISSYDFVNQLSDITKGSITGAPLNGEVNPAASLTGCLAVRVPSDWANITVRYKGDITLESTAFEINRGAPQIKWCSVAVSDTAATNSTDVPAENTTEIPKEKSQQPILSETTSMISTTTP